MPQLLPLAVGKHSINLDEIKKQYGTPPWGHRIVVTDQMTGVVIGTLTGLPAAHFLQGRLQVISCHLGSITRIIDTAAGIDEFSLVVETKEIRRPEPTVSPSYVLALIPDIPMTSIIIFMTNGG